MGPQEWAFLQDAVDYQRRLVEEAFATAQESGDIAEMHHNSELLLWIMGIKKSLDRLAGMYYAWVDLRHEGGE